MMQWQRALKAIVEALTARLEFHGTYEYRVVLQDGAFLDLQAVRKAVGLPDLRRVQVWPGVAGAGADVALGSSVLVSFIDGDPGRPFVVAYAADGPPGFVPTTVRLRASSTIVLGDGDPPGVAREGDNVAIGQLTVAGVAGVTLQFTPAGGDAGIAAPSVTLSGVISSSSAKVRAE